MVLARDFTNSLAGFYILNSWIFSRAGRDSAFTDSDKRMLFSCLFVGTLFVCLLSDEEIKKKHIDLESRSKSLRKHGHPKPWRSNFYTCLDLDVYTGDLAL